MGARKCRRTDRALRPPMRSPGRPPGWRREHRLRFWDEIARGLSSEEPGHDNLAYVPCTSDTAQPDMGGPHITALMGGEFEANSPGNRWGSGS